MLLGVAVVLAGLVIYAGLLNWFGRLPGDIRYDSGALKVYVPIASMLLLSLFLSIAFAVLRRFL